VDPETDVEALVRGRQERQRLLLDPTRTFRFVMDEIALRRRLAPATVLRGQLRRLRALQDGFDHIEIGVIPDAAPMHAWTMTGFDIEGDVVEVGLHTRRVLIRDPREVDEWRRLFDRLAAHSLRGDALATLLREIDAWLSTLPEQRRPRSRPPLTGTSPALSTPTSRPLRESNRDRRASERV
jgi:Domain of unknown function (DUF5753)